MNKEDFSSSRGTQASFVDPSGQLTSKAVVLREFEAELVSVLGVEYGFVGGYSSVDGRRGLHVTLVVEAASC